MTSQNIQSLNKKYLHGPYNVLKKVCTLLNIIDDSIKQYYTNTIIIGNIISWFEYLDKITNKKIGYLNYNNNTLIIKYAYDHCKYNNAIFSNLCAIDLSKINSEFIILQNTNILSNMCINYVEDIIKKLCINIKQISAIINPNKEKNITLIKHNLKYNDDNESNNYHEYNSHYDESINKNIIVHKVNHHHIDSDKVCDDKVSDDSHKDCHSVCKKKYSNDCKSTSEKTNCVEQPPQPHCPDKSESSCQRGNIIKCISKLYRGTCVNGICNANPGQFEGEYIVDTQDGSIYQWNGTEWTNTDICLPCYFLCDCGIIYYICVHHNVLCIYDFAEHYNLVCGDVVIDTMTGDLLTLKGNGKWKNSCNIIGPMGPTGPTGATGPIGNDP